MIFFPLSKYMFPNDSCILLRTLRTSPPPRRLPWLSAPPLRTRFSPPRRRQLDSELLLGSLPILHAQPAVQPAVQPAGCTAGSSASVSTAIFDPSVACSADLRQSPLVFSVQRIVLRLARFDFSYRFSSRLSFRFCTGCSKRFFQVFSTWTPSQLRSHLRSQLLARVASVQLIFFPLSKYMFPNDSCILLRTLRTSPPPRRLPWLSAPPLRTRFSPPRRRQLDSELLLGSLPILHAQPAVQPAVQPAGCTAGSSASVSTAIFDPSVACSADLRQSPLVFSVQRVVL